MSDQNSRRKFLQWMGASSGAILLTGLGCGGNPTAGADGSDVEGDGGTQDGGVGDADAAETGPADASGADAKSPRDGGGDTGGSDAGDGRDAPDADEATCEPTGSDVEGPFHQEGAPERTVLADANEPGERLVITGTVYESDCATPVADAMLDVWHADADGDYHGADEDYRLRGQMKTDANGEYRFETIRPGRYPEAGSLRPEHIHFIVSKPGFAPLTTQLYFAGDPYLAPNDPCSSVCNSGDPTLIIDLEEAQDNVDWQGTFDIVLTS